MIHVIQDEHAARRRRRRTGQHEIGSGRVLRERVNESSGTAPADAVAYNHRTNAAASGHVTGCTQATHHRERHERALHSNESRLRAQRPRRRPRHSLDAHVPHRFVSVTSTVTRATSAHRRAPGCATCCKLQRRRPPQLRRRRRGHSLQQARVGGAERRRWTRYTRTTETQRLDATERRHVAHDGGNARILQRVPCTSSQ